MSIKATIVFIVVLSYSFCKIEDQKYCGNIFNGKIAKFLISYARWRGYVNVILLDNKIRGCGVQFLKKNIKQFNDKNLFLGLLTTTENLKEIVQYKQKKTIVSTFIESDYDPDSLLDLANGITRLGGDTVGWLIVVLTNITNPFQDLRFGNFAIDTDIVIALLQPPRVDSDQIDKIVTIEDIPKTVLLNFTRAGNNSIDLFDYCPTDTRAENEFSFCLIQGYKAKRISHGSITIRPLGLWNSLNGTEQLRYFVWMELRTNFFRQPLIAGVRNSSRSVLGEETIVEDDDLIKMQDFYRVIVQFLNATEVLSYYTKLGARESDGEWSDLLGAVTNLEVDIGVDNLIRNLERSNDMVFLHDIMATMRNIYVQPERSNEVRDIFMEPFEPRLILCVIASGIIFSIILTINNNIVEIFQKVEPPNTGFIDSVIWCVGAYSQQGTISSPRWLSGRIIVLMCLIFSFVIYNAYSAFITSVLSVEITTIRDINDLLNSKYEIGYIKNSQDEIYLRSTNISQLNEIYLRGYLYNNISNVTEGLLKVIKGNYGFFASGQVARKELLRISEFKCRKDIDEIPIRYTKDDIAFAVAKKSVYKRLLNLCVIRMHETGVFKYLQAFINPQMMKCRQVLTYQSAILPDLLTAFSILVVGIITGVVFMIFECIWNRRVKLYGNLKERIRPSDYILNLPHLPYTH